MQPFIKEPSEITACHMIGAQLLPCKLYTKVAQHHYSSRKQPRYWARVYSIADNVILH